MSKDRINFFSEDINYTLPEPEKIRQWIDRVISDHQILTGHINYIFCTDEYLHKINLEYLDHDTYTDIITFDNSEEEFIIDGDIYISIERVRENAAKFEVAELREIQRVMIHGVLHLLGFEDHSEEEKEIMRSKEQESLDKLSGV